MPPSPRPLKEPYPVETIQLCPPAIREAIAKARAAIEQVSPQAHAHLAAGAEAAEVMGALTEDIELARDYRRKSWELSWVARPRTSPSRCSVWES
jgi:hypothetical protein